MPLTDTDNFLDETSNMFLIMDHDVGSEFSFTNQPEAGTRVRRQHRIAPLLPQP